MEPEYSLIPLSYKDLDKLWREFLLPLLSEKDKKDTTNRYYPPNAKQRPHIHWTNGDYIGTDSHNLRGRSPQQIYEMWNGTRNNAINKNNWDLVDQNFIQKILAQYPRDPKAKL